MVADSTADTPAPEDAGIYGEGRNDSSSPELDYLLATDEDLPEDL